MEIVIEEFLRKGENKVWFNGKPVRYWIRGNAIPLISGYPYPDFLWLPEAEEGEGYSVKTDTGFELNAIYEKIEHKQLGPFSYIEILESGEASLPNRKLDFRREITDNYPGKENIKEMLLRRFSRVLTRMDEYEERVIKNQIFDGKKYEKFVSIEGKNNSNDTNMVLKLLYPSRELMPKFNQENFNMELKVVENVIKRDNLKEQVFEKYICEIENNELASIIKISEIFSENKGEKRIWKK